MKAVFLDKDGTLIPDLPHNVEPACITLCRGAGPALRLLARLGYRLFVVTNQPGIAFGRFAAAAMDAVSARLRDLLPGLLLKAAHEHGIDLRASWMVGDILHDVEAGNRAGCRTILIDNGNETEWRLGPRRVPTRMAPDLYTAAVLIASHGDAP